MKKDRDMAFVRQVLDPEAREKAVKEWKTGRKVVLVTLWACFVSGTIFLLIAGLRGTPQGAIGGILTLTIVPIASAIHFHSLDAKIKLALAFAELQKSNSNPTPQQGETP